MSTTPTRQAGLPTVAEFMAHQQEHPHPKGGGLWSVCHPDDAHPHFVPAMYDNGTIFLYNEDRNDPKADGEWWPVMVSVDIATWTPVQTDGSPLPTPLPPQIATTYEEMFGHPMQFSEPTAEEIRIAEQREAGWDLYWLPPPPPNLEQRVQAAEAAIKHAYVPDQLLSGRVPVHHAEFLLAALRAAAGREPSSILGELPRIVPSTYTPTRPTVDGWYWWKRNGELSCVEVKVDKKGLWIIGFGRCYGTACIGEFCGPILPPGEPDAP